MHNFKDYGFDFEFKGFDWPSFKAKRDAYIKRLNGIYEKNLGSSKVELIRGEEKCFWTKKTWWNS